eukprot:TRINITY_DN1045_c0_g1_i7.p1 TRINITY_DN1045_c0_g1~~TRINITY_DN1045_c0_g1_i7.p1  ORF type:complete len:581 (+),score=112.64 TRINITY_DN1045_c0_g1_i7:162-1904(+)
MKSFAICLACLAALVLVQARKMEAGAYRQALSESKPTEDQTVDEILADVPGAAEETTESSYKDFDPTAAFKEDSSMGTDTPAANFQAPTIPQDVAIQPSAGLSLQQETGATIQGVLETPMSTDKEGGLETSMSTGEEEPKRKGGLETPMSTGEEPKLPANLDNLEQTVLHLAEKGGLETSMSTGEEQKLPANLDNLEQTVLHLAEKVKKTGKADDSLMAMITTINRILEDTIITDLVTQYNEAVDSVFRVIQAIQDCSNASNSSYQPIIKNLVSIDDYNLSYWDGLHYNCRQEQLLKNDLRDRMGGTCDALKDRCVELNNTFNGDGQRDIVDWRQCLVENGKYHGSMWLGDYYQDQHAFWVALWDEMNRSAAYVAGNCSVWEECESNRTRTATEISALGQQCNALQASMDDASCKYKKAVDARWDVYEGCCKTTEPECPPVIAKAERDIEYLDAQYRAAARIQCYMSAFAKSNIEQALSECRATVASTVYAPPNRYPPRIYNSVTPFPACPVCPVVPHECGDKMSTNYVTGPSITATNPRYKNMSYIAGTPAYETMHYRPAAAKHIVAECSASCCPNKCR